MGTFKLTGSLLVILLLAAGANAEMIVGDASTDMLTILDTDTGELTDFLPITTPHIVSLAYNHATGELFCSDTSEGVNQILSIDLETGVTSLVVQIEDFWTVVHSMAIDPATGELYAIDQHHAHLYRVDIGTASLVSIDQIKVDGYPVYWITGADFDPVSGELYVCIGGLDHQGELYTVDTATAEATFVAYTHRLMGIGFDANGDLYGVENAWGADHPAVYLIDKATGAWTDLGTDHTGRNIMSIDYVDLPSDTIDCQYTISPLSGTLPFTVNQHVSLSNTLAGGQVLTRQVAARINLGLANGSQISNWRGGFTNIQPGDTSSWTWNQNLPAISMLAGTNTFTLVTEDVTPAPYNQPPYPPSGDTCVAENQVECSAP